MTENFIEFAHDFDKLPPGWPGKKARLVCVLVDIRVNEQDVRLEAWDCEYSIPGQGVLVYPLNPSVPYLFCLFNLEGRLVPSYRKDNDENRKKYCRHVSQLFTFVRPGERP